MGSPNHFTRFPLNKQTWLYDSSGSSSKESIGKTSIEGSCITGFQNPYLPRFCNNFSTLSLWVVLFFTRPELVPFFSRWVKQLPSFSKSAIFMVRGAEWVDVSSLFMACGSGLTLGPRAASNLSYVVWLSVLVRRIVECGYWG